MRWHLVSPFKNGVRLKILAVLTVILFTMAAVHNNDVFWGDSTILSALRADNETWRQFFARFDLSIIASVSSVLVVSVVLLVLRQRLEAVATLLILPAIVFTVALPKVLVKRPRPEGALEGMTDSFPSGTATVSIFSSRQVRIMRTAISPRLAIRMRLNIPSRLSYESPGLSNSHSDLSPQISVLLLQGYVAMFLRWVAVPLLFQHL